MTKFSRETFEVRSVSPAKDPHKILFLGWSIAAKTDGTSVRFDSPQRPFFLNAIEAIRPLMAAKGMDLTLVVEYHYVQEMRLLQWSPDDLVNWLKESDIHFILTHPHQGNPRWNVAEVHAALQRLKDHPGFPYGVGMDCPVFLQHKYAYLLGVRPFTNPTLAIQLPTVDRTQESNGTVRFESSCDHRDFDSTQLRSFLEKYNEGDGWVVKHPFVTMREGLQWSRTPDHVLRNLAISTAKFGGRIPYTMVQPRLTNRKEYKVVVLNGVASHIIPQCANGISCEGSAFRCASAGDVMKFAEMAVLCLSRHCPGSQADGLIRVDVMETKHGNLIVNEFESLEAVYETPHNAGAEVEGHLKLFLMAYWVRKVECAFETFTLTH